MVIKCLYRGGFEIVTKFSGTFKDAENYFLGKFFNIGNGDGLLRNAGKQTIVRGMDFRIDKIFAQTESGKQFQAFLRRSGRPVIECIAEKQRNMCSRLSGNTVALFACEGCSPPNQ